METGPVKSGHNDWFKKNGFFPYNSGEALQPSEEIYLTNFILKKTYPTCHFKKGPFARMLPECYFYNVQNIPAMSHM